MHGCITSHGGDLNENDNLKIRKLVVHCYKKLHGAILTKMKIIKIDKQRYYLLDLWDGSINVISGGRVKF